jgi:pimeloyl-ACP methyl ester carboxylesterase
MSEVEFPGAEAPQRCWSVVSNGIALNVLEWGDAAAEPIVLTHGMWDHARSFAVLAPLLAQRFRVLALDARGHGDSAWASNYTWPHDVWDIVNLIRHLERTVCLVGHSKGGGQATDAARCAPQWVRKLVNIDGFGPPPFDDLPPAPQGLADYLDKRRQLRDSWRPYASVDDLVERRRAQNPRLSREWLRYFAYFGARCGEDGWRWKSDPYMAHGFGPWRPEWIGPSYRGLRCPMLAIVGSEPDTWGPLPPQILEPRLAHVPRLEHCTIRGAGHFVHIEKPAETAAAILDFLSA